MSTIYEITISDNDNQVCFAELPTDHGTVSFEFHIRRCFGNVFLDVYLDGENIVASSLCLENRYAFGYGGYALYYIDNTHFEWRHYDLA